MKKPATGVDITNNGDKVTDGGACKAGNIYVGDSFTLVAKPKPADADEKDVIWSSSNGSVATVDADGKVTIKSSGNATITAKIGNVSTTCTISSTTQVEPGYTPSPGGGGCYGKSTPVGKGWCWCDYNKHDWVCENDGNGSSGNKPSGGGSGGNNTKPSKTTTTTKKTCNISGCAQYSLDDECYCILCEFGYESTSGGCEKQTINPNKTTKSTKKTTKKTTKNNNRTDSLN